MEQTEKGEWLMTPDGQLVQVAAKKKHSKMSKGQVTDNAPEGSYVFSNAKYMRLHKDDFTKIPLEETKPIYKEGEKPKEYKSKSMGEVLFKDKKRKTPAELVKATQKYFPLITDKEQKYNPFIQRANQWNKENRQEVLNTILEASELIKPSENDGVEVYPESETNPQKFRYGGYTGKIKVAPRFQSGDWISGALSGAGAGAGIGAALAGPTAGLSIPIGAILGGVAGGVGAHMNTTQGKKKEAQRIAEYNAMMAKQKESLGKQRNIGMLGTAAQMAIPNTKAEVADYSGVIQKSDNTYDRVIGDYKNLRDNSNAINTGMARSLNRTAMNSGMNTSQLQNFSGANTANAINAATQSKFNIQGTLGNLGLQKEQSTRGLRVKGIDDQVNANNQYEFAKEGRLRQGVEGFTNNEMAYEQGLADNDYRVFAGQEAIKTGSALEMANNQARFSNNLNNAGYNAQRAAAAYANSQTNPETVTGNVDRSGNDGKIDTRESTVETEYTINNLPPGATKSKYPGFYDGPNGELYQVGADGTLMLLK